MPGRLRVAAAGISLLALGPVAHALEHVTLRNGFSLDCSHHELVGDRMRFYTGADNASYQELRPADIAAIETLPDPPPPAPLLAPAPTSNAAPTLAEMRDLLARAGADHNIDVELLASVIKAESNFRIDAVSRTGARGLMQLMPGTAHDLGVTDATRADQNIAGGTAYLDALLKRYKDNLALALAAYNAGPAAVERFHGIPPFRETRAYVARVMNDFYRRKMALKAAKNTTETASLAPR